MCEAGRIRHHLKHNLWRNDSVILFVGYQADGSLGRRLLNGEKRVNLFGEEITVNAEICSLQGKSGHADRDGLLDWISGYKEKPKMIFVNHGDNDSCEDFKNLLNDRGYRAEAPYSGTEYDLISGKMTIFTEGKKIDRQSLFKAGTRAEAIYNELVSEAERLLNLARSRKGKTNKDNAKLTSQIRELIEKWKN